MIDKFAHVECLIDARLFRKISKIIKILIVFRYFIMDNKDGLLKDIF
jgi:hypothetical protein